MDTHVSKLLHLRSEWYLTLISEIELIRPLDWKYHIILHTNKYLSSLSLAQVQSFSTSGAVVCNSLRHTLLSLMFFFSQLETIWGKQLLTAGPSKTGLPLTSVQVRFFPSCPELGLSWLFQNSGSVVMSYSNQRQQLSSLLLYPVMSSTLP